MREWDTDESSLSRFTRHAAGRFTKQSMGLEERLPDDGFVTTTLEEAPR